MTTELDQALERIQAKVAERRAAGDYPPGLEESLDAPFQALMGSGRGVLALEAALAALQAVPPFSPVLIETTSRLPGGSTVHAAVGRLVGRQTAGVLEQMGRYRMAVDSVVRALAQLVPDAAQSTTSPWTDKRIDELLGRLAALEQVSARLDDLEDRVARIEGRVSGPT